MDGFKLTDVIDVNILKAIADSFSKSTGMAAVISDMTGEVAAGNGQPKFCTQQIRVSAEGKRLCAECETRLKNEAMLTKRPYICTCHTGLTEFIVPIVANGRQLGTVRGGGVLTEVPDEQKLREKAKSLGADEDAYIEAAGKVPVIAEAKIHGAAELLFMVMEALAGQGEDKLRISKSAGELANAYGSLSGHIEKAEQTIDGIVANTQSLKERFEELAASAAKSDEVVKKTDSIVKQIKDVSEQTRILGFNASIEAARSGAAGAGFGVIAQEVRRLADDSQKRSDGISNALENIESSINTVNQNINAILENMNGDTGGTKELAACMGELKDELENLDSLRRKAGI